MGGRNDKELSEASTTERKRIVWINRRHFRNISKSGRFTILKCQFLDATYKLFHTIFVFLCLTLISKMTSSSIHVLNGNISVFLMAESKKDKLIEAESVVVVARCSEVGEMGRCQPKGTRLPTRWLSSGDLVNSMVTRMSNILLYTWKLLRGNTFTSYLFHWDTLDI